MSRFSELADDLATEVLSEAAETFFGQRKELERECELFHKRVNVLLDLGQKALSAQKVLHKVLVNDSLTHQFYQFLNLDVPESLEFADADEVAARIAIPFAWTLRGRYFKLLSISYNALHVAVEEYIHGAYRNDPRDSRRKIALFGYRKMQSWAKKINEKVTALNTQQAPSEVLQFVKRLDVQGTEMEKCIGASCEVNRDCGLLYETLDFSALGLPVWPDLPSPEKIRPRLKQFCNGLFPGRNKEIKGLLQELTAQS